MPLLTSLQPLPPAARVSLDQPDAGIYRNVEPVPWPGVGGGAPANQAGPNAAMMRLGLEEQENQQIRQLAQQYGDDYAGLIKAVEPINPKRAFEIANAWETSKKEAALRSKAESESSIANIQKYSRWMQVGINNPDLWPGVRGQLLKEMGPEAPKYDPILPQPGDPQLADKLTNILSSVAVPTEQFLDAKAKAAQLYLDGKKTEAALTILAGAKTPEQRQHAEAVVKAGGLGEIVAMAPDAATAQQILTDQQAQKPADDKLQSPEVEAIKAWSREHGGAQPTQKDLEQIHRGFKEAGTVVRVTGAGQSGGLTSGEGGGLEYAGTLARILGRVPIGLSRSGSAVAIMNEAARQTKLLGRKPIDSLLRSAIYQGDAKALANVQKLHTAADAYENKAQAQLDIVDNLSDKVGRTRFPILNQAIMAGKTSILGDPDATLLLNAIQTASAEYAKIMMGGTASAAALTDSAQKEAQKLLNVAMNQGTLKKATALMRQEMDLTINGFDASEKHIMERMGEAGGATAAPAGATPSPDALRKKYNY